MWSKSGYLIGAFALMLLAVSCNKQLGVVRYETHQLKLENMQAEDSSMLNKISPFRAALQKEMDEVIAVCAEKLTKAKPESSLGNALADLMLETANQKHNANAQVAVINYGGIRIPEINAGNITVGKVYELMPFDNRLVVVELNGKELLEFLTRLGKEGGWPISGVHADFENGVLLKAVADNKRIQSDAVYRVLLSDYLANGGDKMEMLISKPRTDIGVLQRDVFIEGLREKGKNNSPFTGKTDGRFVLNP